ncbi:MAG: hypothetical protein AAGF94_06500, partial [Pseudomonadota bacterium]
GSWCPQVQVDTCVYLDAVRVVRQVDVQHYRFAIDTPLRISLPSSSSSTWRFLISSIPISSHSDAMVD